MKKERMYEAIVTMIRKYDAMTGQTAGNEVIKNPAAWTSRNNIDDFYLAAAEMLIDTLSGMGNTNSRSIESAIKRVIKNTRENLRGMYTVIDEYGNEKHVVIDGYRCIRLNSDIPSVYHAERIPIKAESINQFFDLSEMDLDESMMLTLPTIAELKAFIAEKKTAGIKPENTHYYLNDYICVNPSYLLDVIQALPDCKAYMPKSNISPIYFQAENGDCVLCPINPETRMKRDDLKVKVA